MNDFEMRTVINNAAEINNIRLDPGFMSGDFGGSADCEALAKDIYHTMMLSFRTKDAKSPLNIIKHEGWKKHLVELSKIVSDLGSPTGTTQIQLHRARYASIAANYPEHSAEDDLVVKIVPYLSETVAGAKMIRDRKNSKLAHFLDKSIASLEEIIADIEGKVVDARSSHARNTAQRIVNALDSWRNSCHAGTLTEMQSERTLSEIKGYVRTWAESRKISTFQHTEDKLGIPDPEEDLFVSMLGSTETTQEITQFFEVLESRETDMQAYDEVSAELKAAHDKISEFEKQQEKYFMDAQNGVISVEEFADLAQKIDNNIALEQVTVNALTVTVANLEASALAMKAMINEFNTLKAYYTAYKNRPAILSHIFSGIPYTAFIDVLDGTASQDTLRAARVYIQTIPERAQEIINQTTRGGTNIRERAAQGRSTVASFSLRSGNTQTATQTRSEASKAYMEEFMKRKMAGKATAATPVTATPVTAETAENDVHTLNDDL